MDDVAKELRAIKKLVGLTAFSVLAIALGFLFQGVLAFRMTQSYSALLPKGGYNNPEFKAFVTEADNLIAAGKYDALITLATQQTTTRPDDPYGHYYLGLACYNKADYKQALNSFNRAAELAPTWRNQAIKPYLEACEKALRAAPQ